MTDDEKNGNSGGEGLPPVGSQTIVITIEVGPLGMQYKMNCPPEQMLLVLYQVQLDVMHNVFQQKSMEKVVRARIAQGGGPPLVPQ